MDRIALFFILMILSVSCLHADCQKSIDSLEIIIKRKKEIETIENSCLCSLILKQKKLEKSIQLVNEIAKHNKLSDTLLFCLWYKGKASGNNVIGTHALNLWKKKYSSISSAISYYQNKNELSKLDTLYKILDSEKMLNELELLKWIETKQFLKDYYEIPTLICRIISSKVNLIYSTLERLEMITNDINDSLQLDKIFQILIDCSQEEIESRIRNEIKWFIIDKYGRKALYIRQVDALIELEKDPKIRDGSLFNIAMEHLDKRRFTLARDISLKLFNITRDTSLAKKSAEIIFKTYFYTGVIDSANIWLKKAGTQSENNRIETIELYQKTGEYKKAYSITSELSPSLARDTLHIKNLLLMDSLEKAINFIEQKNISLKRFPYYSLLWEIRVNLFSNRIENCFSIFDSILVKPAQLSEEVLKYKYWLLLLSQNKDEIELFRQIEYTFFKENSDKVDELFCKKELTGKNIRKLALYIAKRFLDISKGKKAIQILSCVEGDNNDSEYLYTLARAHIMNGNKIEGKKILEKLIVDFTDIYSIKARQLLSETN